MAVLVEAISVIVRRDAIEKRFTGGWEAFVAVVPNSTFCADDQLVRVGFMIPDDAQTFVEKLEEGGLIFLTENGPMDLVVVDQRSGPSVPCDWLEFDRLRLSELDSEVSACWLFTEPPCWGTGVYFPTDSMEIEVPDGWQYEGSLSEEFHFVPLEELDERLTFLRHENGEDVYLGLDTGKEVYVGRTGK